MNKFSHLNQIEQLAMRLKHYYPDSVICRLLNISIDEIEKTVAANHKLLTIFDDYLLEEERIELDKVYTYKGHRLEELDHILGYIEYLTIDRYQTDRALLRSVILSLDDEDQLTNKIISLQNEIFHLQLQLLYDL